MASVPDRINPSATLGEADADRLFADFTRFERLAVGVSGGADSVALVRLLDGWRLRTQWPGQLIVLTVDHGLRQESAEEAAFVSNLCGELELPHRTLQWLGEKPVANLQGAARAARYALLRDAMRDHGAEALVLAHHADDQIETFLDRLTRGSGVYGLGAMRPDEPRGYMGLHLLRPLLEVPKALLVATLEDMGQRWCEDPSNQKPEYKRVRLRQLAAQLEAEGLEVRRLSDTIRRMRRTAEAIDCWVDSFWGAEVTEHPAGPLKVSAEDLAKLPDEVMLRFLAKAISRTSGQYHPVRMVQLEALVGPLLDGATSQKTLGGCVLRRQAGDLFIWAELGRQPSDPIRLQAGDEIIWEGRFKAEVGHDMASAGPVWLGTLASAPEGPREIDAFFPWPRAAFEAAPALWSEHSGPFVPGLCGREYDFLRVIALEKLS
ncbi:tRNA lysidine(34) synthetase TilS [Roseibium sp.]|uniref:tRNA lysidine(34) synthetase TilS n=1 Tax=Roseibium sp. TaxID=1936156 RepID=UPI003A980AF7